MQLAVDEARREVVVNVQPDAVCNVEPIIEALRKTLGAGARTVYEVQSEMRIKPAGAAEAVKPKGAATAVKPVIRAERTSRSGQP